MKLKELWIIKLIIFFIINNFVYFFKIEIWRYFKLCILIKYCFMDFCNLNYCNLKC